MSDEFSVGSHDQNWAQLRSDVKNCRSTTCDRYKKKLPVFFPRKKDTVSNIRFMFISQEPATNLRGRCNDNAEKMEKTLIEECSQGKGVVPHRMVEILGKGFDPTDGKVYWTHSLKCVPESNQDIKKQWNRCAPLCKEHFKREIEAIPLETLVLIPFGNYALALCRHLLEGTPLSSPKGIMRYMRRTYENMQEHTSPDSQEKRFLGKTVLIFPFVHPSHRTQHLKRYGSLDEIEKCFVKKIREMSNQSFRA
jgi:uracil-DNA glycosylase